MVATEVTCCVFSHQEAASTLILKKNNARHQVCMKKRRKLARRILGGRALNFFDHQHQARLGKTLRTFPRIILHVWIILYVLLLLGLAEGEHVSPERYCLEGR